MSDAASVTVEGMEDLLKKLQSMGADIKKEAGNAGKKAMLQVEAAAKTKCPVDNGPLRASLNTQVVEDSGETVVKTGTNLIYGPYVEYGTGIYAEGGGGRQTPWLWKVESRKWAAIFGIPVGGTILWHGSRPHPFLRPAWDENKDKVMDDLQKNLETAVAKYAK